MTLPAGKIPTLFFSLPFSINFLILSQPLKPPSSLLLLAIAHFKLANLKWAIAKRRREEGGFNGWDKIKKLIENGSEKKRVGILPAGRVIARENTKIFSESGEEIGLITSGTFGPSVNAPVAMGYINTKYAEIGTKIQLEVRGKKHGGKVSELPFFKKSYVK